MVVGPLKKPFGNEGIKLFSWFMGHKTSFILQGQIIYEKNTTQDPHLLLLLFLLFFLAKSFGLHEWKLMVFADFFAPKSPEKRLHNKGVPGRIL